MLPGRGKPGPARTPPGAPPSALGSSGSGATLRRQTGELHLSALGSHVLHTPHTRAYTHQSQCPNPLWGAPYFALQGFCLASVCTDKCLQAARDAGGIKKKKPPKHPFGPHSRGNSPERFLGCAEDRRCRHQSQSNRVLLIAEPAFAPNSRGLRGNNLPIANQRVGSLDPGIVLIPMQQSAPEKHRLFWVSSK